MEKLWFFTDNEKWHVADQTLESRNSKLDSTHCILLIWPPFKFSFVFVSNSTFQTSWTTFSDQNGFLLVIRLQTILCHILISQPTIYRDIIYRIWEKTLQNPWLCTALIYYIFYWPTIRYLFPKGMSKKYPLFNSIWHLDLRPKQVCCK